MISEPLKQKLARNMTDADDEDWRARSIKEMGAIEDEWLRCATY